MADWALDLFRQRPDKDFMKLISPVERPANGENWGVVSYAIARDKTRFQKWRQLLESGVDPRTAWEQSYGKITAELAHDYETWLVAHRPRFHAQWQPWHSIQESLSTTAEGTWSAAYLRAPASRLSAQIDPRCEDAGIVIELAQNQDYYYAQVVQRSVVELQRSNGVVWNKTGSWSIPKREQAHPITMAVQRHGDKVILTVNDRELVRVDAPAKALFGFYVRDGSASFDHVAVDGLEN
jgi:hypothetical protein